MKYSKAHAEMIKKSEQRGDEMDEIGNSTQFFGFPTEIMLQIFSQLDAKTLVRVENSCGVFGSKRMSMGEYAKRMSMAEYAGVTRANAKGCNLQSVSSLYLCELANTMHESVNAGEYGAMRQVTKRPP